MIKLEEEYRLPSAYAEFVSTSYANSTSGKHKKDNGQYFTSKLISDFMANMAKLKSGKITILDPGCGSAILSCSLIEQLISNDEINEVELTLYETDVDVLIDTRKVVDFLSYWLQKRNIRFDYVIHNTDFVLDNIDAFNINTLFGTGNVRKYDYIISNPPYFKISKSDKRSIAAKDLVYGQPNIYSLFMGLSAKLLNENGELIFITPRSFAAGNYFKAFRNSFFKDVSISEIHIFESRNKMFKRDNVLQENIILRATKQENKSIKISVSGCDKGLGSSLEYEYQSDELLDLKSKDKILFIPSNQNESDAIKIFEKWSDTLSDFNIKISTGPVVAFRCNDYLKNDGQINGTLSPLIWLHNIKEMEFIYPLQKGSKPILIENTEDSRKVLIKNKNYVLLRRFSSKDDKNRLVCTPYFSLLFNTDMIGVENHINYIHRPNGELSDEEILGISALYSSSLFDTYFRTFNGNTQVGATELKNINMPSHEKIIEIGSRMRDVNDRRREEIDKVVNDVFNLKYINRVELVNIF